MKRAVDLLVVGAGPGGGAAAAVAAEQGLDVLVVDRKKEIGMPVQCAEFIPLPLGGHARGDAVLLQRIAGMKSVLPSGEIEHTDFPGLMVDRARFDQALAKRARSAGAQVWHPCRLDALSDNHAIVIRDGEPLEVQFKLLIAADGPHSTVAELSHLPPLKTVNTRQYTVDLYRDYDDTDIWLSADYPGGYAWLFPKKRFANLGLGADKRFLSDLKAPLEALHTQLIEQGLVGEAIHARTGGAIPVGGMRERLNHGHTLFVGDAGGLTHPITGGGIAAAVVSGERAGQAAADWLRGDASALAGYDEDMKDQFQTTLDRAVKRRQWLEQIWQTEAANDDGTHRRGWIAFPEYFAA